MSLTKSVGVILLAIWLILTGIIALIALSFTGIGIIMGLLAIAAGIALLFSEGGGISSDLGTILLSAWLILLGLVGVFGLRFPGLGIILGILALAAGLVFLFQGWRVVARWGVITLAIWLIIRALMTLLALSFTAIGLFMALLAILAGILIVIQR